MSPREEMATRDNCHQHKKCVLFLDLPVNLSKVAAMSDNKSRHNETSSFPFITFGYFSQKYFWLRKHLF